MLLRDKSVMRQTQMPICSSIGPNHDLESRNELPSKNTSKTSASSCAIPMEGYILCLLVYIQSTDQKKFH